MHSHPPRNTPGGKRRQGFLQLTVTSRSVQFLDTTTHQKAGVWYFRLS